MNTLFLALCLSAGDPPPLPPEPLLPQPIPQGVVPILPVPPPPLVPIKIPTLPEFSASFVPTPGIHEVIVIHPVSKRPIQVVFKLPEGKPKIHSGKRSLEFIYGNKEVELIFRIGGKVDVRYD